MSKLIDELKIVREKSATTHYVNKNTNFTYLTSQIQRWFKDINFPTQTIKGDGKWLIQARKNNWLRSIVAGARSIDTVIDGTPDDFTVRITTGKWINNSVMVGFAAFITCGASAVATGICATWTLKIKRDLKKFIEICIDFEKHNKEN